MNVNIEKEVEINCIELTRRFPFFGYILMQMPKVFSDTVPTFGVGKLADEILIKLFISNSYVKALYSKVDEKNRGLIDDHIVEILKHELLHVCFYHFSFNLPDKERQAIAMELEVNSYLDRNKLFKSNPNEPEGIFPEDFKFPERQSTIWYYDKLKDNKKYQEMQGNSNDEKSSSGESSGGKSESGESSGGNGSNGGKSSEKDKSEETLDEKIERLINTKVKDVNDLDSNDDSEEKPKKPMTIDDLMGKMLDSHDNWDELAKDPVLKEMIQDLISKSNKLCQQNNGYGDIPNCLLEKIQGSLIPTKPIVPWQRVLRNFVSSAYETSISFTMRRKSKRFGIRPGVTKEEKIKLLIGIDTSGSINNKQLNMFFNELTWIAKDPLNIVDVVECDTEIQRTYPFKQFDGTVKGRGGTDVEPMLKMALDKRYDVLILFTDLGTPKINKIYNVPILWCVSGGSYYFDNKQSRAYQHGVFINLDEAINPYD